VLICVAGVVVISFFGSGTDNNGHETTMMGYVWVLASTVVYSCAETFYGRVIHTNHDVDASYNFLFLGFVGLFTFFLFWPGIFILDHLQVEVFEYPTGATLWGLVVTVFLDAVFNSSFFVGIYFTSPLFMSVGSLLAIPTSVVVDWILNQYVLPFEAFFGMAMIILGFLGLNLSEVYAHKLFEISSSNKMKSCLINFGRELVKDLRGNPNS